MSSGQSRVQRATPLAAEPNDLAIAKRALAQAQTRLNAVAAVLSRRLDNSPDFIAAKSANGDAQWARANAVNAVMAALAQQPDYQAILAARRQAQTQVEALRDSSGNDLQALQRANKALLDAIAAQRTAEERAMNNSEAVQKAEEQVVRCKAALDVIRQQAMQSWEQEPAYAVAAADVADAQQQVQALSGRSSAQIAATATQ